MDASSATTSAWRIGQTLVLDGGRREVVVEAIDGDRVRCHWVDRGTPRSWWIPARRLAPLPTSRDDRTFLIC